MTASTDTKWMEGMSPSFEEELLGIEIGYRAVYMIIWEQEVREGIFVDVIQAEQEREAS